MTDASEEIKEDIDQNGKPKQAVFWFGGSSRFSHPGVMKEFLKRRNGSDDTSHIKFYPPNKYNTNKVARQIFEYYLQTGKRVKLVFNSAAGDLADELMTEIQKIANNLPISDVCEVQDHESTMVVNNIEKWLKKGVKFTFIKGGDSSHNCGFDSLSDKENYINKQQLHCTTENGKRHSMYTNYKSGDSNEHVKFDNVFLSKLFGLTSPANASQKEIYIKNYEQYNGLEIKQNNQPTDKKIKNNTKTLSNPIKKRKETSPPSRRRVITSVLYALGAFLVFLAGASWPMMLAQMGFVWGAVLLQDLVFTLRSSDKNHKWRWLLIRAGAFFLLMAIPVVLRYFKLTLSFLGPESSFNAANAFFNWTGISPTTWQALSYGFYYFGALLVIGIAGYLYFRFYADKPAENLKSEKDNNDNAELTQSNSSAITKSLLLVAGLFALNYARGIIAGLIGTARPIDFAGGAFSGGLSQNFLYSIFNWLNTPSNAIHSLTTNFPSGHVTLAFFAFYMTAFLFYRARQDYKKAINKTGKGRRLSLIVLLMVGTGLLAAFTMFARFAGMAHSFAAVFVAAFVFAPAGIFLVRGVIEGGSTYLMGKIPKTLKRAELGFLGFALLASVGLVIASITRIAAPTLPLPSMLGFGSLLTGLVLCIPCMAFWIKKLYGKHRETFYKISIILALFGILGIGVSSLLATEVSLRVGLYVSLIAGAIAIPAILLSISYNKNKGSEKTQRVLLFIAAGVAAVATVGLAITLAVSNAVGVTFSGGLITALQSGLLVSAIFGAVCALATAQVQSIGYKNISYNPGPRVFALSVTVATVCAITLGFVYQSLVAAIPLTLVCGVAALAACAQVFYFYRKKPGLINETYLEFNNDSKDENDKKGDIDNNSNYNTVINNVVPNQVDRPAQQVNLNEKNNENNLTKVEKGKLPPKSGDANGNGSVSSNKVSFYNTVDHKQNNNSGEHISILYGSKKGVAISKLHDTLERLNVDIDHGLSFKYGRFRLEFQLNTNGKIYVRILFFDYATNFDSDLFQPVGDYVTVPNCLVKFDNNSSEVYMPDAILRENLKSDISAEEPLICHLHDALSEKGFEDVKFFDANNSNEKIDYRIGLGSPPQL